MSYKKSVVLSVSIVLIFNFLSSGTLFAIPDNPLIPDDAEYIDDNDLFISNLNKNDQNYNGRILNIGENIFNVEEMLDPKLIESINPHQKRMKLDSDNICACVIEGNGAVFSISAVSGFKPCFWISAFDKDLKIKFDQIKKDFTDSDEGADFKSVSAKLKKTDGTIKITFTYAPRGAMNFKERKVVYNYNPKTKDCKRIFQIEYSSNTEHNLFAEDHRCLDDPKHREYSYSYHVWRAAVRMEFRVTETNSSTGITQAMTGFTKNNNEIPIAIFPISSGFPATFGLISIYNSVGSVLCANYVFSEIACDFLNKNILILERDVVTSAPLPNHQITLSSASYSVDNGVMIHIYSNDKTIEPFYAVQAGIPKNLWPKFNYKGIPKGDKVICVLWCTKAKKFLLITRRGFSLSATYPKSSIKLDNI